MAAYEQLAHAFDAAAGADYFAVTDSQGAA